MAVADTIVFYFGVVISHEGELKANTLKYHYVADNMKDPDNRVVSTEPVLPNRPFDGDVGIAEPLKKGSAIIVIENRFGNSNELKRVLVLIDQEKYETVTCT
ncbi:MAG: hypothetical protein EBR82_31550 [Caulobacteraceae bacterium]|nr:hypothetical protein [Caulobacteraceae bacterium]